MNTRDRIIVKCQSFASVDELTTASEKLMKMYDNGFLILPSNLELVTVVPSGWVSVDDHLPPLIETIYDKDGLPEYSTSGAILFCLKTDPWNAIRYVVGEYIGQYNDSIENPQIEAYFWHDVQNGYSWEPIAWMPIPECDKGGKA